MSCEQAPNVQVAREIVLAKERYGDAVEVKDIIINGKPTNFDALKALLDTLHTPSVATVAFRATTRAHDAAPPAAEVSTSNIVFSECLNYN